MSQTDLYSIADKQVVITGGTAGIGLGVAEHFVNAGARVVITGRRPSGHEIAAEIGAHFVEMDVSRPPSVTQGMAKAAALLDGEIHVLILNAGIGLAAGSIGALDLDRFKRTFEVNVFGVVQGLRDGLQYMKRGAGVIITSSPAGTQYTPGALAYSSSKAAVNALTRVSAIELGPHGIRVNAILPGVVESELSFDPEGKEAELAVVRTLTATGMVRKAAEMGPIYQFIASDASMPMTGGLIESDDGLSTGYSTALFDKAFGDKN